MDVPGAFRIEWATLAAVELDQLRAFDRPSIRRAVDALEHQALTETINRKPLRKPLSALPDATWEVRVDRHRVLYRVDGGTVRVLRVILKTGTTGESL
jgi:mRNA-degrading endonuclease RelE of RelBE toxin-antitoxin system